MNIALSSDERLLVITDCQGQLPFVRTLPGRHWHGQARCWTAPYVREVYDLLASGKKPVEHIPRPEKSGYRVFRPYGQEYFILQTLGSTDDVNRCRKMPDHRMYSQQDDGWLFKPTAANLEYVNKAFPGIIWEGECEKARARWGVEQESGKAKKPETLELPADYEFKTVPYKHQVTGFMLSRDLPYFGLLMEPGTGKTKLTLDTAAWLFLQGKIDSMLVVCPNSVKDTWLEELEAHLPDKIKTDVFLWEPKTRHKIDAWIHSTEARGKLLRVLIMNVEAFSTDQGADHALTFVAKHNVIMVVDESTRIKSPSAKRTKRIIKVGRATNYRRILSGFPAPQSPLDMYTQLKFLHADTLPFSSYFSFRNRYALLGGFNGKVIVGFSHTEELQEYVNKVSYRVLKADCLDLPEKVYTRLTVDLSPEQKRLYAEMRDEMTMEMSGIKVSVQYALQKLTKLARITGGFFSYEQLDDDTQMTSRQLRLIDGPNPKMDALLEVIEDAAGKVIIWAKFRAELDLINKVLTEKFGEGSTVLFHGGVQNSVRQVGRRAFQQEGGPRFFVGQPQAGGIGITLTKANTVVYFSNDFNLENRIQSEDRAHRISQTRTVTYTDIVGRGTLDIKLLAALRRKKGLSDLVTGDPTLKWI